MENKTSNKKSRKTNSYGFYTVLSLCLIAVGVAAWSAVSAFSDFKAQQEPPKDNPPESSIEQVVPEADDAPAQNELPNVEYDPPTEPQPEPQKETVADYFIMPIKGNILKNFDSVTLQYSATLQDMRLHEGIDIIADAGTAIRAAGNGTVTEIYEDSAFGFIVVIDHGNGIVAKYCGLEENIGVKSGQTVSPGTEIGTLGSIPIESADGAHLHFEMYKSGKATNPLEIMEME